MKHHSRRTFLAAAATTATTVAGCTQWSGPATETSNEGGADGESSTESTVEDREPLQLETLEAAGSSAGTVRVEKPGTVTLVDFFATWCQPCKEQMPALRSIDEEYPDIHMLSITWEGDEELVTDFWEKYDATWPVAIDPDARTAERYGVSGIPTMVIFDEEGRETWRHMGLSDSETIESGLETALS